MRVLISAYACEPDKGSEPEVGLRCVDIAAREHDVWVMTRENNVAALRRFVDAHPQRRRIRVVGVEIEGKALDYKKRVGLLSLHVYHELWQRRLAEEAVALDAAIDFDVVHHATFATYWSRAGVAAVDKPLVWGPVGGGVVPPWRLVPTMGVRGALGDLTRLASRPVMARLTGAAGTARRAAVIIAQNHETAAVLDHPAKTRVIPNGLVAATSDPAASTSPALEDSPIVSAGRLIGWKGTALAIEAMAHLEGETLEILGDGPDRSRLERLTAELGLGERVVFRGKVTRHEALRAIGTARAFLHPALHDDSPLTVVEALSLGTPVVSLDIGGPPVLSSHWPSVPSRAVTPTTRRDTARRLADALSEVAGDRTPSDPSPSEFFAEGILAAYREAVVPDTRSTTRPTDPRS